ncbi:MAG: metallophosphoesterase [Candidatus Thermoplasmatota archaeon]|nr:metallophosphoesterase [Candidatus Thermoplasmatota archaeon]
MANINITLLAPTMKDNKDEAKAGPAERKRSGYDMLLFLSIVSMIIFIASAGIAAVYSLAFSSNTGIHWPYFAVMIGCSVYVLGSEIVSFMYHRRWLRPFYLISSIMMGAFFYMFMTAVAGGILLGAGAATGLVRSAGWFLWALRVFIIGGVAVPVLWGLVEGRFLLTKRVRVTLKNFRGKKFRIVLISDVHVGLLVGKHRLKRIKKVLRRERPDMIVSAGDLLDTNPRFLGYAVPLLREIASLAPSYAVVGNHEYYHGFEASKRFLTDDLGYTLLDNRSVIDRGTGVWVLGVDDPSSFESMDVYAKKIEELVSGIPPGSPIILVNHQPLHFRKSAEMGVGLMLSGHTHSGQMWPGGMLTKRIYREGDRGLNRVSDSYMYVCIGTGSWGPPMRVGAPSEIVVIDIEKG